MQYIARRLRGRTYGAGRRHGDGPGKGGFCSTLCSLAIVLCAFLSPEYATADLSPLNGAAVAPNIAEFHVEADGVRAFLEIYPNDAGAFADLAPTVLGTLSDTEPPFAGLSVWADGARLSPELISAERRDRIDRSPPRAGMRDPVTGLTIPAPPSDPSVIALEIHFNFAGGRPEVISFAPPRSEEDWPLVTIGMLVYHSHVPVIDFRYLSAEATLQLNWDDPWYSRFDATALTRHHRYPRMAYLYAEPYEIRHEALARVRDAAALVGLIPVGDTLTDAEKRMLVERAAVKLNEQSPVTIDGTPAEMVFDRAAYMRIGFRGLEILGDGEPVDVDADILGLIWSAPTDGYPGQATVSWSWFDERSPTVQAFAVDAAGPMLSPLSKDNPVLVWTNHFKRPPYPPIESVDAARWSTVTVPAGSIALGLLGAILAAAGALRRRFLAAGAAVACLFAVYLAPPFGAVAIPRPGVVSAELSSEDAVALSESLLRNVYRAFDFREEAQVYDRLALTVDGALLEEVYLDQRRSLRVARAGGADARVTRVEVAEAVATRVEGTAANFSILARWRVLGEVGHWGHRHRRVNGYVAKITIAPQNGAWKIIGFDLLAQERLS